MKNKILRFNTCPMIYKRKRRCWTRPKYPLSTKGKNNILKVVRDRRKNILRKWNIMRKYYTSFGITSLVKVRQLSFLLYIIARVWSHSQRSHYVKRRYIHQISSMNDTKQTSYYLHSPQPPGQLLRARYKRWFFLGLPQPEREGIAGIKIQREIKDCLSESIESNRLQKKQNLAAIYHILSNFSIDVFSL